MSKILIIAEIGCNHNGDVNLAYKMVDRAKQCGVDAVKFQTFNSNKLISKIAPKAEYQLKTTGTQDTQLEMTKKLELSHEEYLKLKEYSEKQNLMVFSTPFDDESADFLYSTGQQIWKIPSGEITNYPLLERIAGYNIKDKKVLLSTGMATIEEIRNAISILEKSENIDITILHCNTEYPTQDEDVNVSAISDLHKEFPNYKIGFSDHSVGYVGPILAVGFGITMIEKHFTLDRNMPGPDHKASIEPEDLEILCKSVRRAEKMLGVGKKIVTTSEAKNKKIARKSIVANKQIKKGDVFSEQNITCKRPGNGISPIHWNDLLGKVAESDFDEDELITAKGFNWEE